MNALTIDVEDYFQVHAFEGVTERAKWDQYPCRVVENTQRVLQLLARFDTRATFFVLGWVAERYPQLVCEIAAGGHEVATHGFWHELIYRQTPQEFAEDLERSLQAIADALGSKQLRAEVLGYRAPAFSVTRDSLWALDVLSKAGLRYDSSIFPLAAHDRYGIRSSPRFAHHLSNGLFEIPVSTLAVAGQNLPVAGGGYFRLYPLWVTSAAIQHLNRKGQPAVVYLHPWEFDPQQPRMRQAPMKSRFRHYVNLAKTESRLAQLLAKFKFAPIRDVFAASIAAHPSIKS